MAEPVCFVCKKLSSRGMPMLSIAGFPIGEDGKTIKNVDSVKLFNSVSVCFECAERFRKEKLIGNSSITMEIKE